MEYIPITKLRHFYKSLGELSLSTKTQLSIVKDINRKLNYKNLISWYTDSRNIFAKKYINDENFFPPNYEAQRTPLPNNVTNISSDEDVISILYHNEICKIDGTSNLKYDFRYIEREVSPYRTTNAEDEDGKRGKSGSGGIDFIGLNDNDGLPILCEIKVKTDENPFYALIQLLTYLSELSTPNQIKRINKYDLFKNKSDFNSKTSFYLYILLVFEKYSDIRNDLLNETQELAVHLEQNIQEIEKFVFLKMHPDKKDKIITKI